MKEIANFHPDGAASLRFFFARPPERLSWAPATHSGWPNRGAAHPVPGIPYPAPCPSGGAGPAWAWTMPVMVVCLAPLLSSPGRGVLLDAKPSKGCQTCWGCSLLMGGVGPICFTGQRSPHPTLTLPKLGPVQDGELQAGICWRESASKCAWGNEGNFVAMNKTGPE